jgi:phosphoribosyl 1,2-cyclic phosphodiesterase
MIRICILASGSAGNAILARAGETALLIDAGLSAKRIQGLIDGLDGPPVGLDGILISHEHIDHTRGVAGLCKKHEMPVFTNAFTGERLRSMGIESEMRYFSTPSAFELGSFHITPFTVPHDAADPVGFVLRYQESSFAVATDLGYAPKSVVNAMRGVNAVLLESNHDEAMLEQDVKRPPSVKQRILSHHGHLSNRAAADLITEIATPDLRHILLAHLSEDCNSPNLALNTMRDALQKTGNSHTKVDCPGASGAQLPYSITI